MRDARRVVALTGSGISAESGVPTFREAQTGLWARYDPQDLATPEAFARDPRLVWEWYGWRRELVAAAEPNAGHRALVELERRAKAFVLITQNVDGLHQRAGNREVVELHGNIRRTRCSGEGVIVDDHEQGDGPPRCAGCGAYLRPDVVWFGEMLPAEAMRHASRSAQSCDLFLSIGTSSLVYPAAGLAHEALENDATVVEIIPGETTLTAHVAYRVPGAAGEVLPELVTRAFGARAGM
ncbi:NAD-dependent protein deacylase [Rubrobacter tropicus]|uniref:NAD-dependent protein deacylase n=1 Tax=Rubrobacter tropicus TaxID=2653851 RepID=A0A6G8QFW5_9ACTN|nr:NAD-dependent protein deacylase [Rubrobacter tropicus]